jgi:hypothetical protein
LNFNCHVFLFFSDEKCILKLNDNKGVLKNIGETWISPNDPCLTFACILDSNRPFIKEIIKTCDIYCKDVSNGNCATIHVF